MVAYEYMQWLVTERNISSSTEGVVIRSMMQVTIPAHALTLTTQQQLCIWAFLGQLDIHIVKA